ncbi:hypothetical protein HPGCJGGD_2566 [Methylobacterium haplocladii]|nr:hypothetical protein HPGCJGGD_2566 [Methylobacterium haplocladii]
MLSVLRPNGFRNAFRPSFSSTIRAATPMTARSAATCRPITEPTVFSAAFVVASAFVLFRSAASSR